VHVLGLRQAAPLASHVALYLNLCLPSVKPMVAAGPLFLEDQLLWIDEADVLLAFTFRRYSVAAAKAVQYFRQRGGKVILITDSASAPAAASAHHVLIARSSSASPFDSYTAAFSVCNALLAAVAQRSKQALGAALERGEGLWDAQWIRPPGG
jgi:DNA-binding MurR/RpiR family transcriptional regulator